MHDDFIVRVMRTNRRGDKQSKLSEEEVHGQLIAVSAKIDISSYR